MCVVGAELWDRQQSSKCLRQDMYKPWLSSAASPRENLLVHLQHASAHSEATASGRVAPGCIAIMGMQMPPPTRIKCLLSSPCLRQVPRPLGFAR